MAALMSVMSSGAQRAAPANVQASGAASSRVGFGTGGLLRIGSARERQNVLAAALANGITHFDTAPIYGFGEAERALGRFLGGQRARVTLTTKFGLRPSPLAARLAPLQRAARSAIKTVSTVTPGCRAQYRTAVLVAVFLCDRHSPQFGVEPTCPADGLC